MIHHRLNLIINWESKNFPENKIESALEYFLRAKDLDALRFRAPSEINSTIEQLSEKYGHPFVSAVDKFNSLSPEGIVGDNLMTDHLHPTITGYQEIGKLFINKMLTENLLPNSKGLLVTTDKQDEFVRMNYNFTHLDSTIGRYRLTILKRRLAFCEKS